MNSTESLAILIIVGISSGAFIVGVATYFLDTLTLEPEESVPIYAGVMVFLGGIATAIFQELSSRYKERRDNARNRWQLVFPILKESYIPWINAGKKFSSSLKPKDDKFTDSEINRILYFICLFFGIRLDFILKHGGSILLGSKEEQEKVENAYEKLKNTLQWAGNDTPKHTSNLQHYFISNNKSDDPMVFQKFADKLDPPIISLKEPRELLSAWLQKKEEVNKAKIAIEEFTIIFDKAIADFSGQEK
ncbi:MAG: hypothetical protein EPO37_07395 [Nitrosarchaeum sp.]|nr:MAG: hypothetical protein EPO37_07395 [Nitrosarchaeum sp.]